MAGLIGGTNFSVKPWPVCLAVTTKEINDCRIYDVWAIVMYVMPGNQFDRHGVKYRHFDAFCFDERRGDV
jgi:hypothetical protein